MSIHNSQAKKRPSYHHDRGQDICTFLNHTFMPPEFCFSIHINMYKTNLVTAAVPAEFQGPSPSAMMTTWFSQSSEQILIDQTILFKMTGSILQTLTTLKLEVFWFETYLDLRLLNGPSFHRVLWKLESMRLDWIQHFQITLIFKTTYKYWKSDDEYTKNLFIRSLDYIFFIIIGSDNFWLGPKWAASHYMKQCSCNFTMPYGIT